MAIHPSIGPGRDIDPQLLHRLAHIVIGWGNVEALLAELLTYLLSANADAMYVLNQTVSISTQLGWIETLSERHFTGDLLVRLRGVFKQLREAVAERNTYVHGLWRVGPEPGTALVQTIRLGRSTPVITVLTTSPDLDEFLTDIGEISQTLYLIGKAIGFLGKGSAGLSLGR